MKKCLEDSYDLLKTEDYNKCHINP